MAAASVVRSAPAHSTPGDVRQIRYGAIVLGVVCLAALLWRG